MNPSSSCDARGQRTAEAALLHGCRENREAQQPCRRLSERRTASARRLDGGDKRARRVRRATWVRVGVLAIEGKYIVMIISELVFPLADALLADILGHTSDVTGRESASRCRRVAEPVQGLIWLKPSLWANYGRMLDTSDTKPIPTRPFP